MNAAGNISTYMPFKACTMLNIMRIFMKDAAECAMNMLKRQ